MARIEYDNEQKVEFIEVANEKGIGPAMRELGYPGSHHTANKWFDEAGMDRPTVSSLQRHAASLGVHYKDEEELAGIQMIMDRYADMLTEKDLDADELNKLSNGYQKVIQTKRLIEGKSVNVSESHTKDATDLEIMALTKAMEEKNAEFEQELK